MLKVQGPKNDQVPMTRWAEIGHCDLVILWALVIGPWELLSSLLSPEQR